MGLVKSQLVFSRRRIVPFLALGALLVFRQTEGFDFGAASAVQTPTLVVLELFTSEGCSSCPRAEQMLADLAEEQPVENVTIVPLAQHVDYWDQLGWVDPYSSPAFSQRQQEYASAFGARRVYTPQMVADGRYEFVGGNREEAIKAIKRAARGQKGSAFIEWKEEAAGPKKKKYSLAVRAEQILAPDRGDSLDVFVAITEDGLRTSVSDGENKGKVLEHIAVARSLIKAGSIQFPGASGSAGGRFEAVIDVDLGEEWSLDNLHAIVFVQARESRRIVAVAEAVCPH